MEKPSSQPSSFEKRSITYNLDGTKKETVYRKTGSRSKFNTFMLWSSVVVIASLIFASQKSVQETLKSLINPNDTSDNCDKQVANQLQELAKGLEAYSTQGACGNSISAELPSRLKLECGNKQDVLQLQELQRRIASICMEKK